MKAATYIFYIFLGFTLETILVNIKTIIGFVFSKNYAAFNRAQSA